MYCGTCGKELRDDSKFCDQCGAIQPELVPDNQKKNTTPEMTPPVAPVIPVAEKPKKPRKKVNKKLLAIIAAVLVVAVAAAILIPIFFPGKQTIYVCVEEIQYTSDGIAHRRTQWEYDEVGNLLSEEVDNGDHAPKWDDTLGVYFYEFAEYDGTVDYRSEWEYDENNNIVKYLTSEQPGYSVEYDYDEDGKITEFVLTWEPSINSASENHVKVVPATYKCEYDDEGRLIRVYVPDGFYRGDFTSHLFEYDKDGTLETVYISAKEATWRHDLSYKDGRLHEIEIYVCPTPYFQSGDESYFNFDRAVKYKYDRDGHLKSQSGDDYTYDEHGNLIEIKYEDGSRTVYEYEERKVNPQQALTFRRRNGEILFPHSFGGDWDTIKHLVPNPLVEQE